MKITILVLFLLGGASLLWGRQVERGARSADEGIASVIPYMLGAALWAADLVLLLGYALWRLFS